MEHQSAGTKALTAVICAAVLAYFGIQTYRYCADPLATTVAYTYEMEETSPANGYVVRDEQVLSGGTDGLMKLSRSEGEKVSKGGQIAVIYRDKASLSRQDQIDRLETRIDQLRYAATASADSAATLKLDNQIEQNIYAVQKAVTADCLDSADESVERLRALVLKRDYSYSGGKAALKIRELQTDLAALRSKAASSTRVVTAPVSGTYSAVVDGYEKTLTPAMLEALTPASLSGVKRDASVSSPLGKLILGDTWYYAATMNSADARDLSPGSHVTLRFSKGTDRDFTAVVQSVSGKENDRVAVVFASRQYLSKVTLLRQQSADVICRSVSGIRVPADAIRVNKKDVSGLYCVVGVTARFKPVKVLYSSGDFSLVQAAAQGTRDQLRNGDQVIITAKNLYDGKIVR